MGYEAQDVPTAGSGVGVARLVSLSEHVYSVSAVQSMC